jgi:hypothetical protein
MAEVVGVDGGRQIWTWLNNGAAAEVCCSLFFLNKIKNSLRFIALD